LYGQIDTIQPLLLAFSIFYMLMSRLFLYMDIYNIEPNIYLHIKQYWG